MKFPTLGIVIGNLGFSKVALIRVGVGMNAADCLKDSIQQLPNAKFVIAVGGCYGFNRDVLQRGDVLVSNAIISQNRILKVEETLLHLFTDELSFHNDYCVSNAGRFSRVYKGKYDLCYANENKSEFGEAIGGEFLIDGGVDPYLLQQKEIVGVIVIKGVIGYDKNTIMNQWQFTATKAATHFVKHKLDIYNYKLVENGGISQAKDTPRAGDTLLTKDIPRAGDTLRAKDTDPDPEQFTTKGTQYMGKAYPSSNDLQFIKTDKGEIFKLSPRIAESYRTIAATLGLDISIVTIIEKTYEFQNRIDHVFNQWLQNAKKLPNAKYYPLSWDGLKAILVDSSLSEVAAQFFDFLKLLLAKP